MIQMDQSKQSIRLGIDSSVSDLSEFNEQQQSEIQSQIQLEFQQSYQNFSPPVSESENDIVVIENNAFQQVIQVDIHSHIPKFQDQLMKSQIIFFLIFIMSMAEITLLPMQIKKHWGINRMSNAFMVGLSVQYMCHSYYIFTLLLNTRKILNQSYFYNQYPQNIQLFLTYQVLEQHEIKFQNVFSFLLNKSVKSATINKIMYFWMFLLTNIEYFQQKQTLDKWYSIQLLIPGWIISIIASIVFICFCFSFPLFACHYYYLQRMAHRRRDQVISRILPTAKQFKTLVEKGEQPCYICLYEFENSDIVVQLKCSNGHIFHVECLKPWIQNNSYCPVCRSEIN